MTLHRISTWCHLFYGSSSPCHLVQWACQIDMVISKKSNEKTAAGSIASTGIYLYYFPVHGTSFRHLRTEGTTIRSAQNALSSFPILLMYQSQLSGKSSILSHLLLSPRVQKWGPHPWWPLPCTFKNSLIHSCIHSFPKFSPCTKRYTTQELSASCTIWDVDSRTQKTNTLSIASGLILWLCNTRNIQVTRIWGSHSSVE